MKASIAAGATAKTDGFTSYVGVPHVSHEPHVIGKMAAHIVLPGIHRLFSNLKTWGLGVYHGLRRKHNLHISTGQKPCKLCSKSRYWLGVKTTVALASIAVARTCRTSLDVGGDCKAAPWWMQQCGICFHHDPVVALPRKSRKID